MPPWVAFLLGVSFLFFGVFLALCQKQRLTRSGNLCFSFSELALLVAENSPLRKALKCRKFQRGAAER